jgi:hypothetical protein
MKELSIKQIGTMNILSKISGAIKKFGKGMLAVFAIRILLFAGAFVIQSCEVESIEDSISIKQELALSTYESLVRSSTPKIQNIVNKYQHELLAKSANARNINTEMEQDLMETLIPILDETKRLLFEFGYTEDDLSQQVEDLNDTRIIIVGLAILAAKDDASKETVQHFSNLFIQSAYAQDVGDTVACAGAALGLDVFNELRAAEAAGKKIGKKLITEAVKTVAKRLMGPIGVAITLAEFGACMWIAS